MREARRPGRSGRGVAASAAGPDARCAFIHGNDSTRKELYTSPIPVFVPVFIIPSPLLTERMTNVYASPPVGDTATRSILPR